MESPNHLIFRPEAIQRYIAHHEEAVLPRFASPRTFLHLWLALALLAAAALLLWTFQVPEYVAGQAMSGEDSDSLLLFLPSESRADLVVGEPVLLRLTASSQTIATTVATVDPQILSPAEGQVAPGASAVALVCDDPQPCDRLATPAEHDLFPIQLAVGKRRAFTLLLHADESQAGLP